MTMTDSKRTDLHNFVRENWGKDMGDTLMDFLPPAGWPEFALKSDLDSSLHVLRTEMASGFASIESSFAVVNKSLENIEKSMKAMNWRITGLISILVPVLLAYATALWQLK